MSQKWRATRQKVIERARGTCEECGIRPGVRVHHLRYLPKGRGGEPLEWLQYLCVDCSDKKYLRDKHLTSLAHRAGAKRRKPKPQRQRCAWCGGRYYPEKHQRICARFGLTQRSEAA